MSATMNDHETANLSEAHKKISYGQCGEDLIVQFILSVLRIDKPNYIDIGAYDPFKFSNTYLFYSNGSNGVCVEAEPILATRIAASRPRDIVLNVAVSGKRSGPGEFFLMSEPTLNTLLREEAERLVREEGCHIRSVVPIEIISISDLVRHHYPTLSLDFLSIDVEGLDLDVVESINFHEIRPKVICVETLTYSRNGIQYKNESIIKYLVEKKYMIFADTYINTIFVDEKTWLNRK
jgi:FkbM family methyltransferase